MPTAQEIQDTFIAAEREPLPLDRAAHVARHVEAWGDNARLAFDGHETHLRTDYLAYRAASVEAKDPGARAIRIRREAADLDYRAQRHRLTADDYAGRVAYQRYRGEHALANEFEAQAAAAEANFAEAENTAHRLRIRACELEMKADWLNGAFDIAEVA